ncbi:MAG: DVU3141 family protein [Desulfobacterales bacterium]
MVLGVGLVFIACTHSVKDRIEPPQKMHQSAISAWVAGQEPGSQTVIDAPEFGGAVNVKVERAYFSAAGLHCKRANVFNGGPPGEPVAVCEKNAGDWVLMPRIWGGMPARGKP